MPYLLILSSLSLFFYVADPYYSMKIPQNLTGSILGRLFSEYISFTKSKMKEKSMAISILRTQWIAGTSGPKVIIPVDLAE
jgi:hypothetical protein